MSCCKLNSFKFILRELTIRLYLGLQVDGSITDRGGYFTIDLLLFVTFFKLSTALFFDILNN